MKNIKKIHSFLFLLLVIYICISILYIGRYPIPFFALFDKNNPNFENVKHIILYIRLPRIFASLLVGGSLAVAGTTYQAIFKNPLVSPDILGASSGSALGIAVSIILHLSYAKTIMLGFILGIVAVSLSYYISKSFRENQRMGLILSGIMISTICSSLLSYIKLIADTDNELPDITYWLMGRLSGVNYSSLLLTTPFLLISLVTILSMRWRINVFTLGEEEAKTLGINVETNKIILLSAATLLTSLTVSVCGIVGFVGLVIPHFIKLLTGNNHQHLVLGSLLGGSLFLLVVDGFSRSLSSYEIPLGILTSLIGAPIFLLLLARRSHAGN